MDTLEKNLYIYKAKCTNVVDGDTIDVKIDLGFDTYSKRRVRLLDVDTPERGQENYKEATQFTTASVLGKEILIQTYKSDVFGRYLANVFYLNDEEYRSLSDELSIRNLIKPGSKWNN